MPNFSEITGQNISKMSTILITIDNMQQKNESSECMAYFMSKFVTLCKIVCQRGIWLILNFWGEFIVWIRVVAMTWAQLSRKTSKMNADNAGIRCTVYRCLCNRIIVHVFNLLDTKPFIETRFTCSFHLYVLLQLNNHAFWSVSVAISLWTSTQRCNGCYGIAVWYNSLQIANFFSFKFKESAIFCTVYQSKPERIEHTGSQVCSYCSNIEI